MKRIELLSPAGNFDCLKAAINNGADAVYLGGANFSARAFAENFDNEKIVEAINYAHLHNVKVYITLNTLLNEFEIENAYKQAKYYYEHNVDALLIQDLGLYYRLRKDFPDFELHASTQMHIHNLAGVSNAKKLGFKRVVLARESSLDLIKECTKEDIEVETFVHGAICVSYSGQCLMSSVIKNRSANKGMCAQCCRLKYDLFDGNERVKTDTDYLLSPKDMCLINDVPKLIEAGVSSLKIEGRMKSPAYVGYVTRLYRKAIDDYYNGKGFILSSNELDNMKLLYNRGFTDTYLLANNEDLFNNIRPNHMGIEIGKVIKVIDGRVFVKLIKPVNQFDGIRILSKNDTGLILNMLKVNDNFVSKADIGDVIEFSLNDKVYVGDTVVKTLDYELEKNINSTKDKLIPINLNVSVLENEPIKVECTINGKIFSYSSNIKTVSAINRPITSENIKESFNKTDKHPYYINDIFINLSPCFISIKDLNDIRRSFYDDLDRFILNSFSRPTSWNIDLNEINEFNQESSLYEKDYVINPAINKESKYSSNFISEFGGLLIDGVKNAYYTLNVSNSYAFEFLLKLGFKNIVLSTELKESEIVKLTEEFINRCGKNVKPYVLSSGKRTLMYLNRDPFIKYSNSNSLVLSDGNNQYGIKRTKNYLEIIEENEYINDKSSYYYNFYK